MSLPDFDGNRKCEIISWKTGNGIGSGYLKNDSNSFLHIRYVNSLLDVLSKILVIYSRKLIETTIK